MSRLHTVVMHHLQVVHHQIVYEHYRSLFVDMRQCVANQHAYYHIHRLHVLMCLLMTQYPPYHFQPIIH
jgi:hypothetical protein